MHAAQHMTHQVLVVGAMLRCLVITTSGEPQAVIMRCAWRETHRRRHPELALASAELEVDACCSLLGDHGHIERVFLRLLL